MKPTVAALLLASACAEQLGAEQLDTQTAEQDLTTDVPALTNATTAFTGAVATSVRDTAAAHGLAISPSAVRTSYTSRNTIGAVPAGTAHLLLVGQSFVVGAYAHSAGLYKIASTRDGVMLYRFDPSGPMLLGPIPPPPQPWAGYDIQDACFAAPGLLQEYCRSFVACALLDFNCPPELPPSSGG